MMEENEKRCVFLDSLSSNRMVCCEVWDTWYHNECIELDHTFPHNIAFCFSSLHKEAFPYILQYLCCNINCFLKLVFAVFYQLFIFSPNDSPSKAMKNVFTSSRKLFSSSKYLSFCIFSFSFLHFPDLKG